MAPHIEVINDAALEDRQILFDLLEEYNASKAGFEPERPLAVLIRDNGDGLVVGGIWGLTYYGWFFLELLFVPTSMRHQGIGTRLMRAAESEAVRRGCRGAWLDTFTFQAQSFYGKLGYTVFGEIDDYPSGHKRIFMMKRFQPTDRRLEKNSRGR